MITPSLVQITFQLNGTSSSSQTCQFTSTPTAGNLLRVSVAWGTNNTASQYSCTDTAGNHYNLTYFAPGLDNTGNGDVISFHCGNCVSHANNVVTITCTGTASTATVVVWEVSGILKVNNPVRAANNAQAIVGGAAATFPSVNVVGNAGDWVDSTNNSDNALQNAQGPGWTLGTDSPNGSGSFFLLVQYKIANNTISSAISGVADDTWSIIAASFIPAIEPVPLRAAFRPR